MKKILFIINCLIISITTINAQELTYCISNEEVTGGSPMFYEFDVYIEANESGFNLSDGIFYMDYNPGFFGTSVVSNGRLFVDRRDDMTILDTQLSGIIYIYDPILTADNTASRFGVVWELPDVTKGFAEEIPTTSEILCHVRIEIMDISQTPDLEFYLPLMDRETFYYDPAADINIAMNVDTCLNFISVPVELVNFTAEKDGRNAILKWQTATEINSDHFDIERSTDAEKWESIGKVTAAGDSQTERNYQFTDVAPFSGDNYYRLKQVDIDGSFEYSQVKVVKFEQRTNGGIAVYPNPANDAIYLEYSFEQEGNIQVELFDVNGKKQFSQNYNSQESRYQININQLVPGTYFLQIISSTETITRKVIKS